MPVMIGAVCLPGRLESRVMAAASSSRSKKTNSTRGSAARIDAEIDAAGKNRGAERTAPANNPACPSRPAPAARPVRQHDRLLAANSSGGNGLVAIQQRRSISTFSPPVTTQSTRRARLMRRIGQRHSPAALVDAGHRDVCVRDFEHRISRHQRCGVAVRAEAEVDQIQHRRRSGDLLKNRGILARRRTSDRETPPASRGLAPDAAEHVAAGFRASA